MTDNIKLPPMPEWAKMDNLNGMVPSEIRTALNEFGREAVRLNATVPDTRKMFSADWCVAARFRNREDVVYDGLVGPGGCPTFENAHNVATLSVAPQPAQQPLTDEQMWELWNKQGSDEMTQQEAITFARAIEQAHGIGVKND